MTRGRHEYNVKLVVALLQANKGKAFNREEVAKNASISKGSATGILRQLHKQNLVERHLVKERSGELRTYYNWKRCEHLARDQCVIRENDCPARKKCCMVCPSIEKCEQACSIAILCVCPPKKEEEE